MFSDQLAELWRNPFWLISIDHDLANVDISSSEAVTEPNPSDDRSSFNKRSDSASA